jgi:hypothetical protein
MTQKELLYIADAYKHEDNIIKICEEIVNYIQDLSLINFLENEIKKHNIMKDKLLNIMEEEKNE